MLHRPQAVSQAPSTAPSALSAAHRPRPAPAPLAPLQIVFAVLGGWVVGITGAFKIFGKKPEAAPEAAA